MYGLLCKHVPCWDNYRKLWRSYGDWKSNFVFAFFSDPNERQSKTALIHLYTVTWCIRCQSNLPRRQNVADPSKSTLLFFQIFTNIHSTMVRIALISFPLLSFHFETQKKCYLCMYFLIKISLPVVPVSFHLTLSTVPFLRCLCHYGICHGLRTLCDAFQSVRFYQFYYDICIPLVTISCFLICFSTYDHGAIDLLFAWVSLKNLPDPPLLLASSILLVSPP